MPARVDWRAHPFAPAGGGDVGKPLACCGAHLLELVQYVCSSLFQERSPLLTHFDCVSEFNGAGDEWHVTNHIQRRSVTASPLEIETKSFGELQLRYAQVVLGSNQLRNLIVQLHVRLQHVKAWNCSRFEPVLLIFQLSFQKPNVFLVHANEVTIDDYLVKLSFHNGDQLIQNIAKGEVGAVPLKKSATDLIESCAVKDELRSGNTDRVGDIASFNIPNGRWRCTHDGCTKIADLRGQSFHQRCSGRGGRKSRRRTSVAEYARPCQVRVDPLEIRIRIDLRQCLRAHLNDYAFASFDLLLCIQKGGIALQRRENRLIQSEGRHSAARDCFAIRSLAAGKNRLTENPERCN